MTERVLEDTGLRGIGLRLDTRDDRPAFAFPFADTVAAAASYFPGARPWHVDLQRLLNGSRLVGLVHEPPDADAWLDPDAAAWRDDRILAVPEAGTWFETATPREGPTFWLRIAPGNLQVYRRDQARAERTRARLSEARGKERRMSDALDLARRDTPMALVDGLPSGGADGLLARRVAGWSSKSKRRLVQTIGRLDLAPIVGGLNPPAMVTLTLPGDWRAVCPDPAAANAIIKRFESRWFRQWGVRLQCIWKREFQHRGAPHWHLWLSPPADHRAFAGWLSRTWTDCLQIDQSTAHGRMEARNSLAAGTGVDYSRAADARDPRLLALYFLKETLGGEGKAYQNLAPEGWGGDGGVGRFWGVKGLDQVVAEVPLTADDGVRIWRALRRYRAHDRVNKRVLRCTREHGHTRRCFRVQRRHATAPASAGWVTAHSGPDLAVTVSRLVDPPAPGRFGWVEGPSLARQLLDARGA